MIIPMTDEIEPMIDTEPMTSTADFQAFAQSLDLDGEQKFDDADLEQADYSDAVMDIEYKDEFIWSFDKTLAILLDRGLTGIMGHPWSYPPDGIKETRDTFRKYVKDDDPFLYTDSPEYEALMKALDWVKENFTGLWT